MSNTHRNTKKKNPAAGFLQRLRFYPDYGMDSDEYDFAPYKLVITALGILLTGGTAAFERSLPVWAAIALYAVGLILCGGYCIINVIGCFSRGRFLCEGLPVLISCIAFFASGSYRAASVVILVFEAAKLFEAFLDRRSHAKADKLLTILPRSATVLLEDDQTVQRKPGHLRQGDYVVVRKNEIVPIDGEVVDGISTVDYSSVLNLKAQEPVSKGSRVLSGCVNQGSTIVVEATCDYADSTAKKLFNSFSAAVKRRNLWADYAVLAFNILFPVVLLLTLVFAVIVPLVSEQHAWMAALRKGAVILLCCCPLGVLNTLELYVFTAVRQIFASGMVIEDSRILQKLSKVETFVCNKTGTITEGAYSVVSVVPNGADPDEPPPAGDPSVTRILELASRAEGTSLHPIARSIKKYCGHSEYYEPEGVITTELPGKGVEAFIGNNTIYCGNAALLFSHGINTPVPSKAGTVVHVAYNDRYLGYILLNDEQRHGNYDALECLRSCGVKNLSLISCDLRSIVRPIASYASFSNVKSELAPEGKIKAVEYLVSARPKDRNVVFLGNGSDELDCASRADISACTGALWDDAAWDNSDVAILEEGITAFPKAVSISCGAMQFSMLALIINLALRVGTLLLAMIGVISAPVAMLLFAVLSAVSNLFTEKIR